MRITQELLIKFAQDFVTKQTRKPNDIVAVFLTGSVLTPEPLIGGTTDIDLVMVHKEDPAVEREVQRVSYEISLDIQHHHQSFYTFHRRLRLNPWLGYALCSHNGFLYDTDHWLEFIQAGVSAQFDTPETVYARALAVAERARQLWFELEDPQELPFEIWVDQYFKAVNTAANGLAVLSGPALPTRRFLLAFPERAEAAGRVELNEALLKLLSQVPLTQELYAQAKPSWQQALQAISKQPDCPPNLNLVRKAYYLNACDAMAESGNAAAAFWPLIETWREAIHHLEDKTPHQAAWKQFLESLGLEESSKAEHVARLDNFLDQVEGVLTDWKEAYGL